MPVRSISPNSIRKPRRLRFLGPVGSGRWGNRPFRGSVVTSALSLALAPNLAGALELGDIHTQSALNEPFVGQVELLDVAPDELDTIKVLLASQAEFDKANTARPPFLTELEFQPLTSPEGRTLIRITSRQPVREPFLDFLIEVNWSQGRLVKAYTVLLDPPESSNHLSAQREQPASRPPVQAADERICRETEELRGRIRELEVQLADTRRLLELSNERIAMLQQTQAEQCDGPEAEAMDTPPAEDEATQIAGRAMGQETTATSTADPTPVPTAPRPDPEAGTETADVGRTPASGHSFRESILWPALASILALLLLVLGWIRHRQRREETPTPREPVLEMPVIATDIEVETDPVEQASAGPATTPTTQSPAPASDPEGETEAADLVSEADIYIAYGRYQEAETLLKKAREKSPHRPEVKHKLIETYYGLRDRPRMEAIMDQMRKTGDNRIDPDQWQRLNAMLEDLRGHELKKIGCSHRYGDMHHGGGYP